ncbi:MAG: hypothetical protein HW380_805 [Magnetococcales bacterium]|nr:hypothetical protein [Magnetococcales bacterium]
MASGVTVQTPSFPRKRESRICGASLDPRFRGDDVYQKRGGVNGYELEKLITAEETKPRVRLQAIAMVLKMGDIGMLLEKFGWGLGTYTISMMTTF